MTGYNNKRMIGSLFRAVLVIVLWSDLVLPAQSFAVTPSTSSSSSSSSLWNTKLSTTKSNLQEKVEEVGVEAQGIFDEFADFLQTKQREIIALIEEVDDSGEKFTEDRWGIFDSNEDLGAAEAVASRTSGGITRVIQRGNVVEKGACSLTLIQNGVLSAERAAAIRGRNYDDDAAMSISEGDSYSAAALSMVLHTRNPMVPTFRSDVRIFLVKSKGNSDNGDKTLAWFGGGADLTPYYLIEEDIKMFHGMYRDLCDQYFPPASDTNKAFQYSGMKLACDNYFYLPARSEHRGTGGIFFDDMMAISTSNSDSMAFVQGVANTWMPSWLPIVKDRNSMPYTDQQREWQLLRRGRYLEFNLLYDRGVKFGLANANPRVEGVMVSAPPLIAWEYNHVVEDGSEEQKLMDILKNPIDWVE